MYTFELKSRKNQLEQKISENIKSLISDFEKDSSLSVKEVLISLEQIFYNGIRLMDKEINAKVNLDI